jgi:hypothetical protein
MEPIDHSNPAVAKYEQCPPQLIGEIHDDATAAEKLYRTMAVINDYELYTMREALTPAQRMEASSSWAKRGGLEAKKDVAQAATQGYQLIINLGDSSETHRSITVDHKPELLPDATD